MSFPNIIHGSELESFNTYTTEHPPVGTQMVAEDGRIYRFAECGGTATVVAKLYQAVLMDIAKWGDQAVGTMAAGATVLTGVGATTTDKAVNVLKYGYCIFDSAADLSPAMRIKDNTVITQGAVTGTITLFNPLRLAVAAATTISYAENPWRDVILSGGPSTALPAGVAVCIVAAASFGWLQTRGPCKVLTEGAILEGDIVVSTATTGGEVMPSAAFETDGPQIGITYIDQPSTEHALIFLTID